MTEKWVEANRGQGIHGYWFSIRTNEAEIAATYASSYDVALNIASKLSLMQPLEKQAWRKINDLAIRLLLANMQRPLTGQ